MTEKDKEAIEILEGFEPDDLVECAIYLQARETISNLIEKQEKIIDKMAEQLAGLAIGNNHTEEPFILGGKEEVIEHYERQVEENE